MLRARIIFFKNFLIPHLINVFKMRLLAEVSQSLVQIFLRGFFFRTRLNFSIVTISLSWRKVCVGVSPFRGRVPQGEFLSLFGKICFRVGGARDGRIILKLLGRRQAKWLTGVGFRCRCCFIFRNWHINGGIQWPGWFKNRVRRWIFLRFADVLLAFKRWILFIKWSFLWLFRWQPYKKFVNRTLQQYFLGGSELIN